MEISTLFSHAEDGYFLKTINKIHLEMTTEEYRNAIELACLGNMSENARIIIHEYAHWIQSVGTPYGFYLSLVHFYENELLRELEELLSTRLYHKNQYKVLPPLKQYIEKKIFFNIHDDKLWNLFSQWIDMFFLIKETEGTRDFYYESVREFKNFFSAYPRCKNTQSLENFFFLPLLLRRIDDFLDDKLSLFVGRQRLVNKELERKVLFSKSNLKAVMASGLNGSFIKITNHSLWESYATVVEHIDSPDSFVFPTKYNPFNKSMEWNEYYEPLRYLQGCIPNCRDNKKIFLDTCICLFDIIFSPPILPQCQMLRSKEFSMFDFDVISRFYAVAEAASYVGALQNFKSKSEYIGMICSTLGWCRPDEVFLQLHRCWDSLEVIPEGKMFQYFINARLSGGYLVLNRRRFFDELSMKHIMPCFLELKDGTVTNTNLSYGYTADASLELLLQCAMIQMPPLFPVPLKHEAEYYQYYLRQELVLHLWEKRSKIVRLKIPKECNCYNAIYSYLKSWVDNHSIDIKIILDVI